jgi:membrane associated rhomboid family serine protease
MIHFKCRCGAGHSVQAAVAAEISRCPVCRTPVRLVCGGPPLEGEISARLIARAGSLLAGSQLLLGGNIPIEAGKQNGKHLLLPGTLISRNHCRFIPTAGRWRLVDDGSTNGSYVNGTRVASRDLADGDILQLGEYEFEFRDAPAAAAQIAPIAPAEPVEEQPFASFDTFDEPIPVPVSSADEQEATLPAPIDTFDFVDPPETASVSAPSPATESDPLDPTDYGSYDVAPAPKPSRPSRVSPAEFPSVVAPDGRSPDAATVKPPLPAPVCPACNRTLTPGAKICVQCGVDVRTGRPILTAQGLDEDQLYGNAETLVNIVSWVLPFGLYPIASEAYGAFKPYATWAIALLTILTSVCFWVARGNPRGPSRQLMLWAGSASPQEIEEIYTEPHVLDESDQSAYEHKVEELKKTVPERQLPLAAYNALPSEHQVFGHFEWYQLLTCAFLHEGPWHLAGNLVFLIVFGSRVNALVGQWKMAVLYPILAIAAGIAYCIAESSSFPIPSLGASGAIMGLAGMYLVLFPVYRVHNVIWFRISPLWAPFLMLRVWGRSGGESGLLRAWMKLFALRGFWVVLFFIAFDVAYTLLRIEDHVAHWAHLGGFVGGVIIATALLLTRAVDARGGDLISVVLGKHAWRLVGKPGQRHTVVQPAGGNELLA